jgi:peptidyl-dipeptidase Dcp
MRSYHPFPFATLTGLVFAAGVAVAQNANPFAAASTLPLQAPRFDQIKDVDYMPAFDSGMKEQLAEINRIANDPSGPTFENTVVAIEKSGRMLDRVSETFSAIVQANTSGTLDQTQTVEAPKLAAQQDAIFLNARLFARVQAVYKSREKKNLDPESRRLLDIYYKQFVHAGANLPDADKDSSKDLRAQSGHASDSFRDLRKRFQWQMAASRFGHRPRRRIDFHQRNLCASPFQFL